MLHQRVSWRWSSHAISGEPRLDVAAAMPGATFARYDARCLRTHLTHWCNMQASGTEPLSVAPLWTLSALVTRAPKVSTQIRHRSLWDHWLIIVLIVVLAGSEWIIRRRRDLT